jgi:hypothetical protein
MTMFAVNDQKFGWGEIVAAAEVWREWQPFFEQTRQALACLRLAAKTGQLPAAAETREAITAFRYAHNLISAEEAQAWLNRWGMTVDSWASYFRGQLLLKRWAGRLGEIVSANPIIDEEVAEVIRRHAVCAGKLGHWAVRLAGRAAMAANSGSLDAGGPSPAGVIARIEAEFERERQQSITPKLIETKIAAHRLDWMRFDCRYLWFAEESIAREAAWCVREDGLTLDEVATNARGQVRQWIFYADEIGASVRPYFLAARQGDLLGPMKIREGYPVFSLVKKCVPAPDDPQIRERAEESIIASLIKQAMNERVKWATSG